MQKINNYRDEQRLSLFFRNHGFSEDRDSYNDYKNGGVQELTGDKKLEMDVLTLLENLGYSANEIGTYLYKDMVISVATYLKAIEDGVGNYDDLVTQLQNSYSQFYIDIARNNLDMGAKTFHAYIVSAKDKANNYGVDPVIYGRVYGNTLSRVDYKQEALILGHYVFNNLLVREKKDVKVKRLAYVS